MITQKDINLVHCIEGKPAYEFEENFESYIDSVKNNVPDYLKNFNSRNIYQPGKFNIKDTTVNLLMQNGFDFIRRDFEIDVLNDNDQNFFNMTVVCDDATDLGGYILWTDLDILILKEFEPVEMSSDKIMTSILTFDKNHPEENFKEVYLKYFKDIVSDYTLNNKELDNFTQYINTYFILGHSRNNFWKDWKSLTFLFKKNTSKLPLVDAIICERYCEEMAATLIYLKNKEMFVDVPYQYNLNSKIEDVTIWHYEEYNYLYDTLVKNKMLASHSYLFRNKCPMLMRKKILNYEQVKHIQKVTH